MNLNVNKMRKLIWTKNVHTSNSKLRNSQDLIKCLLNSFRRVSRRTWNWRIKLKCSSKRWREWFKNKTRREIQLCWKINWMEIPLPITSTNLVRNPDRLIRLPRITLSNHQLNLNPALSAEAVSKFSTRSKYWADCLKRRRWRQVLLSKAMPRALTDHPLVWEAVRVSLAVSQIFSWMLPISQRLKCTEMTLMYSQVRPTTSSTTSKTLELTLKSTQSKPRRSSRSFAPWTSSAPSAHTKLLLSKKQKLRFKLMLPIFAQPHQRHKPLWLRLLTLLFRPSHKLKL